ncbi:MAG: hypothetical protein VX938_13985, partial [Myxococcota bacterium]|nr:hypothetical protein [Myxococcota bacterium]
EVACLYHEDRTEVTHRELLDAVGGWFASQEGRRYRLPMALREVGWVRYGSHDEGRLLAAARAQLRKTIGVETPLVPASAYSGDPRRAVFRAFCRHHGIHLPLDPNPRPGAQGVGLERALRSVLASPQGPHNVLLISDLHTADHLESLRRMAQAARSRRHKLMVMCPSDLDFEALPTSTPPGDKLEVALDSAQRARARQSLVTFEAFLRPAGVSVIRCRPEDGIPRVVQQLNRLA